jgi:6-phosphogluconolactonase
MQRIPTLAVALALAAAFLVLAAPAMASGDSRGDGAVYTLTNSASGNAVAVFDRDRDDGSLTAAGTVATGGVGTGTGLGSQGALVLDDHRLFAVNAGSNTVSLLQVGQRGRVRLADVAPSGGARPISLTVHGKLVYVLNAGDATRAANIKGFLALWGQLIPLPGSSRPLSTAAPDPAQIEFSPDGRHLVVTEKATNMIVTYRVRLGFAGAPNAQPSAGETPFGFAFDKRGRLIVSEAFGGAPDASVLSSYALADDGTITPITPNAATTETAACWVVVTRNGRYTYTTNTGSNSISGYGIGNDGSLKLLDADGVTASTGATPIDLALTKQSRLLYALNSGVPEIQGFAVNGDGSLDPLGAVGGLPASAVGLAAR